MNVTRFLFALVLGLPFLAKGQKSTTSSNPVKNGVGMEFARISPGEFVMGCSTGDKECDPDEGPAHRVQITKPFEIGKYEVTQAQWQAVMGSNPSTIKGDNRPVETISKQEAEDFLAKLTAQTDGYRYRLPTEAEWEYAARAGEQQPANLDEVAWYAANSEDQTHPVGQKKPNAWGLYDTLGNVREWVSDLYARDYYSTSALADPTGPASGQAGPGGNFGRGRRFNDGGADGQPGDDKSLGQRGLHPISQQTVPSQDGGPGEQQGGPSARGNYGRGNFGFNGRGRARQVPIMRGGAWDNPASFVRFSARYHYFGPTLKLSDIGFRAVREAAQSGGGK